MYIKHDAIMEVLLRAASHEGVSDEKINAAIDQLIEYQKLAEDVKRLEYDLTVIYDDVHALFYSTDNTYAKKLCAGISSRVQSALTRNAKLEEGQDG